MNRQYIPIAVLLIGLSLSMTVLAQTTRYVSTSGSDTENLCSNSANPCRTVSRAIDVAVPGDAIQLAAGVYTETLSIAKSLSITGEDRDTTIIQAHALAGMAARNVIRLSGGAAVQVDISDVTVRHGRAAGKVDLANLPSIAGGGIFNDGVTLSLERVNLTANWALTGGGMFNRQSSPVLHDVTFSGNTSLGGGGMVNFQNSSPILTDVVFSGNVAASSDGGGMLNSGNSSPKLTDVVFVGNFASAYGGGMANAIGSEPLLINVLFSANTASENGGGMENLLSSPTLVNVTFNANSSWNGGAIANLESDPALTNVVIWNNQAGDDFAPPTAQSIHNEVSTPVIVHSLIAHSGGSGAGWETSLGTDGGGNLDADPMFFDELDPEDNPLSLGGNQRLSAGSPAIDAGDNTPFEAGGVAENVDEDLDGNPRIFGPAVDLGPYEYLPPNMVFQDRFEPAAMLFAYVNPAERTATPTADDLQAMPMPPASSCESCGDFLDLLRHRDRARPGAANRVIDLHGLMNDRQRLQVPANQGSH